jgi:AraC family transcriptional regulator, regulatory protein of adaptative response / methylated-DNA-[protein]-cysteine methyltransferase
MKPISTVPVVEESGMSAPINDEDKWSAITQRNPLASRMFIYRITTTKIFYHPIFPAHLPQLANVVFFPSLTGAEQGGFHACLQCCPDSESSSITFTRTSIVTKAYYSIVIRTKISLDELATESKLSKFHFQRTFKSITGITPQQYKITNNILKSN